MPLVKNEEHRMLQDSAREFLNENAPIEQIRKLRDACDETGYSEDVWQKMAELGWASIILPTEYEGLDFGVVGLGAVLEETGRTLTASPLLASAVVGAYAILLGGSEQQKNELLPDVASGELTLALALEETHLHDPTAIAMPATSDGSDYILNGNKIFVLDGHTAKKLIVATRTAGAAGDIEGISLFVVDADHPGISRQRTIMIDSRNAAKIIFDQVRVPTTALLGEAGAGLEILEATLDRGRVAIAAEMLGSALEVFDRTMEYLKQREQFGVRIGTFQALQHRAAIMYVELELARSVVMQALSTVDDNPNELPRMASLAKACINEVAKLVSNEAVQMHGGIGVTDELDIGLFLKRARVAMQIFGDTNYHQDRYATLAGY